MQLESESQEYPVSFASFRQPALNPYRFRGRGKVAVHRGMVGIEGPRAVPFWFTRPHTVIVPFEEILNVATNDRTVSFLVETRGFRGKTVMRPVRLVFEDARAAADFASLLPTRLTEQASRERAEAAQFGATLQERNVRPLVVPALVAINIAVYLAVGARGAGYFFQDGTALIAHGSNFGPLTTGGEPWRLFTSMFLHGNIFHIAINMYAFYDTGRLAEQLFGRGRFLLLYVLSGIAGSVASVWWNPFVNSVGASGAIFGVYGGVLAFMVDRRNGVPPTVMSTHLTSLGIFVLFNLSAAFKSSSTVDNAAHVGGLVGGALLGFALAHPIDFSLPRPGRLRGPAGVAAAIAVMAMLLSATPKTRTAYEAQTRFVSDITWFKTEEKTILDETKVVIGRIGTTGWRPAEVRRDLMLLAERWNQAHDRFATVRLDPRLTNSYMVALQTDLVAYTDVRSRMTAVLARGVTAQAREAKAAEEEVLRLAKESGAIVDRMKERAHAAQKGASRR